MKRGNSQSVVFFLSYIATLFCTLTAVCITADPGRREVHGVSPLGEGLKDTSLEPGHGLGEAALPIHDVRSTV